jgi:hypothetical protein
MIERFTDEARRALRQARTEAEGRLPSHDYIGTEHVLVGLLDVGGTVAEVLKTFGVTAEQVRKGIGKIVQPGIGLHPTETPALTPRCKTALQFAVEEAEAMRSDRIECEHLLLGLLREEEGVAAQVLMDLGLIAPWTEVRREVCRRRGWEYPTEAMQRQPGQPLVLPPTLSPLDIHTLFDIGVVSPDHAIDTGITLDQPSAGVKAEAGPASNLPTPEAWNLEKRLQRVESIALEQQMFLGAILGALGGGFIGARVPDSGLAVMGAMMGLLIGGGLSAGGVTWLAVPFWGLMGMLFGWCALAGSPREQAGGLSLGGMLGITMGFFLTRLKRTTS